MYGNYQMALGLETDSSGESTQWMPKRTTIRVPVAAVRNIWEKPISKRLHGNVMQRDGEKAEAMTGSRKTLGRLEFRQ